MPRSRLRQIVVMTAVSGLLLAFPAAAAATIVGGCTGEGHATSGNVDLTSATEWHIKRGDVGGGTGTAPAPIRTASVSAYGAGIPIAIAGGSSPDGKTSGSVEGVAASTFATFGARFVIAGTGTATPPAAGTSRSSSMT